MVDAVEVGKEAAETGVETLEELALEGSVGEHKRQLEDIEEQIFEVDPSASQDE